MALNDKTINFDINKRNIFNLTAKQYDTDGARSFTFRLIKNSIPFDLTGLSVKVGGTKPDGKDILNNCNIIDANKGIIELELTTQMQVVAGTLNLELIILKGETRLSTIPFEVEIIQGATCYSEVQSSDEFGALQDSLWKVDSFGIELNNKMDKDTKDIAISQINKNKGKIDQTYLSEELLKQIAGDAPINAVPEDESITNIKLADKSVDFKKTSFFNVTESINKFNKNAVTNEGFILNGSGGYKAQDGCCVSDFIPVNEGQTIRANTNWNGEFYNKNKEFISQKEFGVEEFIVPRGAYYYRQSIQKAKIDEIIITINIPIDEYIPYSVKITMTNELLEIIENDVNVKPNNTTFFRCESINLYDYKKATEGYIIGGNGEPTPNETGCISDFISIEPNTMYYFGDKWNGGYYTKNKVFIKQKEFGVMNELSPNGAYYVRVSIPIAKKENYMLVKNYMPEEYIAYESSLKFTDNENLNGIAEQIKRTGKFDDKYKGVKWVALGDSLTEKNVTAKENYTDFVSKDLKITCINHGIGGTGYMRRYDINKAFYQRVADLPQDADVITIFGSGNDLALMTSLGDITDSTIDTLCGCINKTIDNLLEKFPTTPIGIIAPTPWRGNTPNIIECQMSRYVDKLEQICKRRGIPYLDLYHYSNLHPDNAKCLNLTYYNKSAVDGNGDGVHPNDEGHKIIAGPIREFVKTLIK
ncbi:TPA: BppU family phage baseplate upper protein [Clostridium perfringens]|nr:BppU family phage baseplate upper protein [Clostridium perfringens]